MDKLGLGAALVAVLVGTAGFSEPSSAGTGQVSVTFTKGGFIVGAGGGKGVLTYRGRRYPFTVSGMSIGFTLGASTNKLSDGLRLKALNTANRAGSAVAVSASGQRN